MAAQDERDEVEEAANAELVRSESEPEPEGIRAEDLTPAQRAYVGQLALVTAISLWNTIPVADRVRYMDDIAAINDVDAIVQQTVLIVQTAGFDVSIYDGDPPPAPAGPEGPTGMYL